MRLRHIGSAFTVGGRNFLGGNSGMGLVLRPNNRPGWYWMVDGQELPITIDLVRNNLRRIDLQKGSSLLPVYEHIGALRWTGLDGITLSNPTGTPYFVSAGNIWKQIEKRAWENKSEMQWLKLSAPVKINDGKRYIEAHPIKENRLETTIIIDYPGIGKHELHFVIPIQPIDAVLMAPTLGYPPWLYYPSRFLSSLGLWKHHEHIAWPQNYQEPKKLLEVIARHRLADLLGALSLVSHDKLVAARIVSYCAGHKHDIELVRNLCFT